MPRMGPRPSEDSDPPSERDWRCGFELDAWSSGASNLRAPRVEPRGVTRARDPRSAWLGASSFLASTILRLGPRASPSSWRSLARGLGPLGL